MSTLDYDHGYGTGHVAPDCLDLKEALENNISKEDYFGSVSLKDFFDGWQACGVGMDELKYMIDYDNGYSLNLLYSLQEQYNRNSNRLPEVKIYRAVPPDINSINDGDWISLNKDYCHTHGKNVLAGDYKILEDKVSIDKIYWDGGNLTEFGFDSRLIRDQELNNDNPLINQEIDLDKGYSVVFTDIQEEMSVADVYDGYGDIIAFDVEMNYWEGITNDEIVERFNNKFMNGDFTDFYPSDLDITLYFNYYEEDRNVVNYSVEIQGGAFDGLNFDIEYNNSSYEYNIDNTIKERLEKSSVFDEITDMITEDLEDNEYVPESFFLLNSLEDKLAAVSEKAAKQIINTFDFNKDDLAI